MDRLKRDHKGRPVFIEMPRRMELMEAASNRLWESLKHVTVDQLKLLQPTGPFIDLVDALIDCRLIMGEDTPTANQIDEIARQRYRRLQ